MKTYNKTYLIIVCFSDEVATGAFDKKGPVAIFTVWNKETVIPDDFLGELVLYLADATEIRGKQTTDDIAAMILPLQRPVEPTDGPYQVIKGV